MITVESLRVFDDFNAYIISPDIVDMIQVASKECWSGDLLYKVDGIELGLYSLK